MNPSGDPGVLWPRQRNNAATLNVPDSVHSAHVDERVVSLLEWLLPQPAGPVQRVVCSLNAFPSITFSRGPE